MRPIEIFDFTGVYRQQDFYKDFSYSWKDCTDLSGVNGFCDESAFAELRQRTGDSCGKIHYFDGGNFHYMSYLMAEKIREPFCLVVIDHHTDMQPPMFEELLSCGCWVKRVLDDNPLAKEAILIGVADQLADAVEAQYQNQLTIYRESEILIDDRWIADMTTHIHYPVYLSVDKDAFASGTAATDWDQGSMDYPQMEAVYKKLSDSTRILGIDICGECIDNSNEPNAAKINNKINRKLAELFSQN